MCHCCVGFATVLIAGTRSRMQFQADDYDSLLVVIQCCCSLVAQLSAVEETKDWSVHFFLLSRPLSLSLPKADIGVVANDDLCYFLDAAPPTVVCKRPSCPTGLLSPTVALCTCCPDGLAKALQRNMARRSPTCVPFSNSLSWWAVI